MYVTKGSIGTHGRKLWIDRCASLIWREGSCQYSVAPSLGGWERQGQDNVSYLESLQVLEVSW